MTRLQVTLSMPEADALARLAAMELRDPRDQIRLVVRQELARRGLLGQDGGQLAAQQSQLQTGGQGDG